MRSPRALAAACTFALALAGRGADTGVICDAGGYSTTTNQVVAGAQQR